ncbi:IclR family transcriptional regulator [Mycobacterium alsense]|uniref:Glycerol operon regulatory protein n=1 Tax=Mycobacterium alsense TaxID=324058 RepID=A0ABD6P4U5_9MYCO|nr:IclR family transcriptional regulator [Mycobacterium alsense]OBG44804.1 IclR family transcriptional regulator [Mycobacterium alsense]
MADRVAAHTGPVTIRALRLLETFTPDRQELSLSELARRAGLPLSTAHRLALDLLAWGAIERDERTGLFHIGLRLWEIASLAPRGLVLREIALPVMEDLAQVTHENVQLGVREGSELVFVERIRSQESVQVRTRVGGRFAMPATGLGLALLAYAPSHVQEEVCASPMERYTERTICDPVVLRRTLAKVRQTGIAISDRQISLDTLSVAAPIFDNARNVHAAISVVVEAGTVRPRSLIPLLQAAALSIGRALSPRSSGP